MLLLTVCHLVDGEGTKYVVCPLGPAEAAAPQHHIEGLWETSDTLHTYALENHTISINGAYIKVILMLM